MTLAGRTALVTGSLSGLGHAIARALAAAGANVMLHGLAAPGAGEAAARALAAETGVAAGFDGADLRAPAEIARMAAAATGRFGGVDILVNNAVVRHFGAIEEISAAEWDEEIAVNLSAAFHLVRLTLPEMKRRGWGRILNVASVFGARGAAGRVGYVTTKTALTGLTRAIAIETARTGVTCNALSPGTVPSPAILGRIAATAAETGRDADDVAADYVAARHPTGRFVAMESVGALAAFLCGPAGADITGATLAVDGGWTAG
ncbi:D-beta-hydroxybutyrate dehydrogenase [uncultured Alphaproteobacteria bacterium]|uniref:D-beta-hydroxybutyrate dehydrogenase n=1 Tax=uncultured Alphaproteobacteria bacterium TaxID=91750 RepID=A0A212KH39_9PROT|nr:D-beta-hydroxybutyrate dehydrogenase [uncultured Alphaproteobacteria bacterium]